MITLLHPSKGRPKMAFKAYQLWKERAVNKDFEYLLGLNETDKSISYYREKYQHEAGRAKILQANCDNVVCMTNKLAKLSTGDILIYVSDDFEPPQNWDESILNHVKGKDKFLLKVDDDCQPFENTVLTIPIMSRSLYYELGYFWYPEYRSMFCDVDLYYSTLTYHIYAPELVFRHHHWLKHGKKDQTYVESEGNWAQGEDVWHKRKVELKIK